MVTKLLPFQLKGAKQIRRCKGRTLLADEMGLGKTIQCLYWLMKCPKKRPVVIVSPATLKWVWATQALQHMNLRTVVLESRTPPKKGILNKCEILIINYEILQYWMDYIQKIKPSVFIIDESHYIKSRSAKRTKAVKQLAKTTKHVIALSGTPLVNRPSELFTTLNLIWPKEFPSFWTFAFRYCKASKRPWGWEFKGAAHLDELHNKLKSLGMIRRLKKDVLKELPEKTRQIIPLTISNKKEYNTAKNEFIKWLSKKSTAKAKRAMKAEAVVKMGYLKRLAAELKMKAVFEWVDNFLEETDEKLILYGFHKSILKQLHDRYKKISVVIDGSTPSKKRELAITSFHNNKKIKIFIGQMIAAGTGITLTAASQLAFVEIDFVPGIMLQAEDRPHRIGQKNAVVISYLIAKDTIEEPLCELLQSKQEVISQVLDGTISDYDLEIYDKLAKSFKRKKK